MEATGLIVEYNPFHNGHLYHLREAAKFRPDSFLLCVMSGNWVQRGEPAIFNKWARAEMALRSGADLVIELPTIFATQSAAYFARGAIKTLDATGTVSRVCFGSEAGDIDSLEQIARLMHDESPLFKAYLKNYLRLGHSYSAALSRTVAAITGNSDVGSIIKGPNDILGVEYLRNLLAVGSTIEAFTIARKGAGYHSLELAVNIASATAIRKGIREGKAASTYQAVPPPSLKIIRRETRQKRGPVFWDRLDTPLMTLLRRSSLQYLESLPGMETGLAARFARAAVSAGSLAEFLEAVKTRRYTTPRLKRILIYLLLGITAETLEAFNAAGPRYLRVLGFTRRGRLLLRELKQNSSLPLIIKPSVYLQKSEDSLGKEMLKLDIRAQDLYNLLYADPAARKGGQDFLMSPLRI
ncbi:MAG TPA: nucleotidyltransferase [Firmicutes bacterium]|nr:nucleotidyltransferase [Bacillota bacterium]